MSRWWTDRDLKRYQDRRNRKHSLTGPRGGRKACYGFDDDSPFPGEYHKANCTGSNRNFGFNESKTE